MLYAVVFYLILVACVFAVRHKLIVSGRREMQKRETEYRSEYDRLESDARVANNVKTDFLRRMSHDIRTPINGIRGMLDIADYYADDLQKQQECRDKIREASGYLLELVNDILDMSKLESGEIVWKDEPFDLRQVLREITSITKLQAAERNIDFSVVEDNIVHAKLIGSTVLLKRICFNLIGNALKYNKENGWLRVSCNEIAFDGESGEYEFVCADSGIGMSEEFQKRMYEPFAQEDPSFKNFYSGSGLGLAIVKKLVDALDGTIDVQSTRGVGTTFTVRLRFKTDKEAANGNADTAKEIAAATEDTAKTAGEKKPLAGVKILLAEDNELNLEIARFMLTTAGAQVDEVYNGRAALDTYLASEEGHYDVLLMDVMMPVMDGLRATKLIRASKRKDASSLPIFAMTANAFPEDVVRVREAGMNEHCPKPLSRDKLIAMILKYVHRRKKS